MEKKFFVIENGYREKRDEIVFEGNEDEILCYMKNFEGDKSLRCEDEDGNEYMIDNETEKLVLA